MHKLMLTLLVGLCSICPLNAGVLSYTVSPSAGQFFYDFTLTNTTGGAVYDLFLSMPTDIANIDTAGIGTPVGWGDATGGLLVYGPDTIPGISFIDWAADFSGAYDLGIGDALGGFTLRSSVAVVQPITFALNGSTDFATAEAATTVPEPGTSLLLSVLAAMGLWSGAKRRSQ